jgi:hypothetical protein
VQVIRVYIQNLAGAGSWHLQLLVSHEAAEKEIEQSLGGITLEVCITHDANLMLDHHI